MLTRVVVMKLANPSRDADRLTALFIGLDGQIPSLRTITAGSNVGESKRAWDFALIATFRDAAGLRDFQAHPAHGAVATEVHAATTEISVVDFTT